MTTWEYWDSVFLPTCAFNYNNLLPGGSNSKEFAYNTGDPGLIPGSGRSPEEGNGYPL